MSSIAAPNDRTARDASPERSLTGFDWLLYALTVIAWSGSWWALALQVHEVPIAVSLFWRFLIAAGVMWAWMTVARRDMRLSRAVHGAVLAMGLAMFSTNFALFYVASQWLISGLLSVVFALSSVINLVFAAAIARRLPRLRALVGATLGVAGIALLFAPQLADQSWTGGAAVGLGLCVAGTLLFCTGNQISARLQGRGVPLLPATTWGMTYGAAGCAIFALASGHSLSGSLDTVWVASLVWLALVSSVLAFWSYLTLLGRIGAGRAGYATVVFPVFALLLSSVVEDYRFTLAGLMGMGLVAVGNVLVLRR